MDKQNSKLLDQARDKIRMMHYRIRTEETYIYWIKYFIFFNSKRHPLEMGEKEISQFLTFLAVKKKVSVSTQNQAFSALLFLYRHVLQREFVWLNDVPRAKKPNRLPVVFTKQEAKTILARLKGVRWIMGSLLYGSGLRLMECLRLRVKDLDFNYSQIAVRDGKGGNDRVAIFPDSLKSPLKSHLDKVKMIHEKDIKEGFGKVYLPYALQRKYWNANREWVWQYIFPASKRSEPFFKTV